jgi:hypothetical protein
MADLWYAKLSSYSGLVPGATHWMVKLHHFSETRDEIEIHRVLGVEAAARLTRTDSRGLFGDTGTSWNASDFTNRFFSEDEAVSAARAAFRCCVADEGDVLVRGDIGATPPTTVLDGPPEIAARLKAITDRYDIADENHTLHRELGDICNAWDAAVEELGLDESRRNWNAERRSMEIILRSTPNGWEKVDRKDL